MCARRSKSQIWQKKIIYIIIKLGNCLYGCHTISRVCCRNSIHVNQDLLQLDFQWEKVICAILRKSYSRESCLEQENDSVQGKK